MNVECYLGEIRMIAATYCPAGWALCDGQVVAVDKYPDLYSLIGNTYGGESPRTFALPDYRGRIIAGLGSGFGLTPRKMGQTFGSESVTLDINQLPSHHHPMLATTQVATELNPLEGSLANPGEGAVMYEAATSADKLYPLAPQSVALVGNNAPHDNMMPYSVINYIIALTGTYPSRN